MPLSPLFLISVSALASDPTVELTIDAAAEGVLIEEVLADVRGATPLRDAVHPGA